MGGDEFCVLLDDGLGAEEAAGLVAGALAEHGDGFTVTASCGTVTLPDEADGRARGAADRRRAHVRAQARRAPDRRGAERRDARCG